MRELHRPDLSVLKKNLATKKVHLRMIKLRIPERETKSSRQSARHCYSQEVSNHCRSC